MKRNTPKILFFIDHSAPTKEEIAEATTYGPLCVFRNSEMIGGEGLEQCDGVAGKVPEKYKHFPTVKQAFETWQKKIEKPLNNAADSSERKPAPPPKGDVWKPNA